MLLTLDGRCSDVLYGVNIWFSSSRCGDYFSRTEIAEFCSGNMIPDTPHDIYAYTDCLRIELDGNLFTKKGTFSASYEKYNGYGLDSCQYAG